MILLITFINHRAKRGGSLFQGGSGEEERSRSNPPGGRSPPIDGREATLILQGVALRSYVFL